MIPTPDEITAWELRYNARYKAEHMARNWAHAEAFSQENKPMRLDHAAIYAEATVEAAESLVGDDHLSIALARGDGFSARLDGKPPLETPGPDLDLFMAWHAGYRQAGDTSAFDGSRGYTPPSGYVCPACKMAEGGFHAEDCADVATNKMASIFVTRPKMPIPKRSFT